MKRNPTMAVAVIFPGAPSLQVATCVVFLLETLCEIFHLPDGSAQGEENGQADIGAETAPKLALCQS
jgi:hypothetical protein